MSSGQCFYVDLASFVILLLVLPALGCRNDCLITRRGLQA